MPETSPFQTLNIAIYQPDIPQNLGSMIRLAACLNVGLHIIEPCDFPLADKQLKRVAMDYGALAVITRHATFEHFLRAAHDAGSRVMALSTKASVRYDQAGFAARDVLMLGPERSGLPLAVRERAEMSLRVPMAPGARSLNIVTSAALVLGEACRQLNYFTE